MITNYGTSLYESRYVIADVAANGNDVGDDIFIVLSVCLRTFNAEVAYRIYLGMSAF